MNILFLVKFYQPFDRGGSEWSTHDLAKLLVERGHSVTILTPNYGSRPSEIIDGTRVKRFPFYKKLKNPKAEITPWWTNNIFWFVYTSFLTTWFVKKEKFDLIHVHSNEFLPAAIVAGHLTDKPTVATFRDYQVICNFGFCLWQKTKACNWSQYFKNDFSFFYENYVLGKNPYKFLLLLVAAVRARILQKLLYFFAKRVDYKIVVSQKVANIFRVNGIVQTKVIENPVIVNLKPTKRTNDIIYIGRFSKGKGLDLYFDIIGQIADRLPKAQFKFIGSGYLKDELEKRLPTSMKSKVVFTGQLDHGQVLKIVAAAALVVVPSVWPEPLPRSAIEAILLQTPVVATNVGGIGEVIINNRYGILASPTGPSLASAITTGFDKRTQLKANILNDKTLLRKRFSGEATDKYLKIYQTAIR